MTSTHATVKIVVVAFSVTLPLVACGDCADAQHSYRSFVLKQVDGALSLPEAAGMESITLRGRIERADTGEVTEGDARMVETEPGQFWFDDVRHDCPENPSEECGGGFQAPDESTCQFYRAYLTLSVDDVPVPELEFEVPNGDPLPICVWNNYCFDGSMWKI